MASLADTLQAGTARLAAALGLERREARLEARILAAHALGVGHAWLIAHDRDELSPPEAEAVAALLTRRERGEPVAYILGEREFFGRMFKVSPDVLIPRPDTELLVETALRHLPPDRPARILDLGTGSGCIAIILALERPDCAVWAVDSSTAALAVAEENARRLGARDVRFLLGDWCEPLQDEIFDLIVSNPPYIDADAPHLHAGDLPHEPRAALTPGQDGLGAIRLILLGARPHLKKEGTLIMEHGYDQGAPVRDLFAQAGYSGALTLLDLAGLERVTLGRLI